MIGPAPQYLPDYRSGRIVSVLPTEAMSLAPAEAAMARENYRRKVGGPLDMDGFYAGLVRDLDAALSALAARPCSLERA